MITKVCTKCGIDKSLNEFHYSADSADKHRNECKSCRNKLGRETSNEIVEVGTKICFGCKTEQSIINFSITKKSPDGRRSKCKLCISVQEKERNSSLNYPSIMSGNKRCSKCGEIKTIDEFYKNHHHKDGRSSECKICHRIYESSTNYPPIMVGYKVCRKCGIEKPITEFVLDKHNKDGRHTWCTPCKVRYSKNLDLYSKYGITIDKYEQMYEKQNGKCAICDAPESDSKRCLHVDHDHKTGIIRNLLCTRCNSAMGLVGENLQIIQNMIDYLHKWENNNNNDRKME